MISEGNTDPSAPLQHESSIAGLVLASGMSKRFGSENKLLLRLSGTTVLERTVGAYLEAGLNPVAVVVGHEAARVAAAVKHFAVIVALNPDYALGQSRALRCGLRALPTDIAAAVIGVGDQPYLTANVIQFLVRRYHERQSPLVVPRYAGQRGNPVLFDRALFPELLRIDGDQGGRSVLTRHQADIDWVDFENPHLGADLDTPDDYAAFSSTSTT